MEIITTNAEDYGQHVGQESLQDDVTEEPMLEEFKNPQSRPAAVAGPTPEVALPTEIRDL